MALHSFLSVIAILWLLYIYLGVGFLIQKVFRIDTAGSYIERLLIPFAFGYGLIGNILTIFGYLKLLSVIPILALLLCLSVISFFSFKDFKKLNTKLLQDFSIFKTQLKSNRIISIVIIIMLVGYFARSLLPPTGFDGLMYHLSTVKLYLQRGGFWDIYFNPQSDFPMLTEMHFMIGLALGNDIIAKGISFFLFIMTLFLIREFSYYLTNEKKNSYWSVLIFMTLSVIIANVPNCDVDVAQALWGGTAILLILKYEENKNTSYVYIASFIAGLSVQSKIFGVFIIPVLLSLLLFILKKNIGKNKKQLMSIVLIPFLMGSLWYVKSIYYNNSVLSGNVISKISSIQEISLMSLIINFLKSIILSPWHYSLFPSYHRGDTIGPIFLIVLPFLFFIKSNRKIKILLTLSFVYLLQILFMDSFVLKHGSSIRYIISVLILLCPVVAYVLNQLPDNYYKKLIVLFVLMSVLINALVFLKRYHNDWFAIILQKSKDEYLLSMLPEYKIIKEINKIEDKKKVMPIYNFSEYLIEKDYVTAHKRYLNKEELLEDIAKFKIGYIFANNVLDTMENKNPFPFVEKELVSNANGFYLFRLKND